MATFTYELNYGGVALLPDQARTFRHPEVDTPFGLESEAGRDNLPLGKHQSVVDLLDEYDRLLPTVYLQDMSEPEDYWGRKLGSLAQSTPVDPHPHGKQVRVGEWFYPTGASRWSFLRMLATSSQVAAIRTVTGGFRTPQVLTMANMPSAPNGPQVPAAYTVQSYMYCLPPRPIGETAGTVDGLYLLTLVDERYWWQFAPATLPAGERTWMGLADRLGSALGVFVGFGSDVEPVYGRPETDSQLWVCQENAARLLDAVANNVGRTVVRNLDGTYTLLTTYESAAVVAANRGNPLLVSRLAGGDLFNALSTLPAGDLATAKNATFAPRVRVCFPQYVYADDPVPHFLNPRYANQRPSAWFEDSYGGTLNVEVTVQSGLPTTLGLTGTPVVNVGSLTTSGENLASGGYTQTIHDTAKALYSGEDVAALTPINQSGLTALAVQLANDYWETQAVSALDEAYPGVYAWQPEGINDVVWTWSVRRRLASTRVMRATWNQSVTEYQHSTPPVSGVQSDFPRGVGGRSVALTVRDGLLSGNFSGHLATSITATMLSGDFSCTADRIQNFPTDTRWVGRLDGEEVLFNGTSGGISGTLLQVVYRGVNGTYQYEHANGTSLYQVTPDVSYGNNLITFGRGQWVAPGAWTSGGVQEVRVTPQVQTIQVFSASGVVFKGTTYYSGQVNHFDTAHQSGAGPYQSGALIWAVERHARAFQSGAYFGGQFTGYSISGPEAPVYLFDAQGSGGAGGGGASPQSWQELDASPIISGVTQVLINQGTHLMLQSVSGGAALLSISGASADWTFVTGITCSGGVLNYTTATLHFDDGIYVSGAV